MLHLETETGKVIKKVCPRV